MDAKPIVFEDWGAVLKAKVPPDRQRRYREAIVKFRYDMLRLSRCNLLLHN